MKSLKLRRKVFRIFFGWITVLIYVSIICIPENVEAAPLSLKVDICHVHDGDSVNGGGCYGNQVTHTHSGDEMSGSGCYSKTIYHIHTSSCYKKVTASMSNTSNGSVTYDACGCTHQSHEFTCSGCKGVFSCTTNSSAGCTQGHSQSDVTLNHSCKINKLICTKDESTVEKYEIACGKGEGDFEGYALSCGKGDGEKIGEFYVLGESDQDVIAKEYTITAGASGSMTDVSYHWSNGVNAATMTTSSNGNYSCYITYKDNGIAAQSTLINFPVSTIDNTPPIINSYSQNVTDNTSGSIILNVSASDPDSLGGKAGVGLDSNAYSWNKGSTWTNNNSCQVSSNGSYEVWVRDAVGNIATASHTVSNIDNNAPEVTLTPVTTDMVFKELALTVSATDSGVGLSVQPYSWDGGHIWSNESTYVAKENGTVNVCVRDAVGNISNKSYEVTNIIFSIANNEENKKDNDAPIITISASEQKNGTIVLTASVANEEAVSYSWDEKNYDMSNTKIVSESGNYTVYAKDAAGNIGEKSIKVTINEEALQQENENDIFEELPEDVSALVEESIDVSSEICDSDKVDDTPDEIPTNENREQTVTEKVIKSSLQKTIVESIPKAGAVTAGGGFLFFGFWWFFSTSTKVYSQEGTQYKKIGKVKIKKKGGIYHIKLSRSTINRALSSNLLFSFGKGFVKKHEGEAVIISLNGIEQVYQIKNDITVQI